MVKKWQNYYAPIPDWKYKRSRELRRNVTDAEKALWFELKRSKLGCGFSRQRVILGYIVDFYCSHRQLIIEVDGGYHDNQKEYDNFRDGVMRNRGLVVIRFTNEEVLSNIDDVKNKIISTQEHIDAHRHQPRGASAESSRL